MRKKTRAMLALEEQHGKPVEQVVADAINSHDTITAAAESLGMNVQTFWGWIVRLRIEVKRVARVAQHTRIA